MSRPFRKPDRCEHLDPVLTVVDCAYRTADWLRSTAQAALLWPLARFDAALARRMDMGGEE